MTKVIVSPGICGFSATISAETGRDKKIRITLETECGMVKEMTEEMPLLDLRAVFTNYPDNPVYRAAARHLKHIACPVPSGILKALEVELGLCLPGDATIVFLKE